MAAPATLLALVDAASGRVASPATLALERQPLDAGRHVFAASPVTPQHWVLRHASTGEWLVADTASLRVTLWPAAALPPGPPSAAAAWRVDGGGDAPCALSVDDPAGASPARDRLYLVAAPDGSGGLALSRAPPPPGHAPWRVVSHPVGGLVTRAPLAQLCAAPAAPPRPQQRVALWSMATPAAGGADGGWLSSTGKPVLGIGPFGFSLWLAQELGTWEKWTAVPGGDGSCALLSDHGRFLSFAPGGAVRAHAEKVGPAERVTWEPAPGAPGCVALRSAATGAHLAVRQGAVCTLDALPSDGASQWLCVDPDHPAWAAFAARDATPKLTLQARLAGVSRAAGRLGLGPLTAEQRAELMRPKQPPAPTAAATTAGTPAPAPALVAAATGSSPPVASAPATVASPASAPTPPPPATAAATTDGVAVPPPDAVSGDAEAAARTTAGDTAPAASAVGDEADGDAVYADGDDSDGLWDDEEDEEEETGDGVDDGEDDDGLHEWAEEEVGDDDDGGGEEEGDPEDGDGVDDGGGDDVLGEDDGDDEGVEDDGEGSGDDGVDGDDHNSTDDADGNDAEAAELARLEAQAASDLMAALSLFFDPAAEQPAAQPSSSVAVAAGPALPSPSAVPAAPVAAAAPLATPSAATVGAPPPPVVSPASASAADAPAPPVQRQHLYVFHDGENLAVSLDTNPVRLRHAIIRGALGLPEGARLPPVIMNWVFIVPNASHSTPLLDRLRTAGVSIYSAGGKRGSVDVELKRQLQAFVSMPLRREGVRVFIASGDCDFAADLRLLQEAGFEAGIIANASARRAYVDQAEHVLSWEALVAQAAAEPTAAAAPKVRRQRPAPPSGSGGGSGGRGAAAAPGASRGGASTGAGTGAPARRRVPGTDAGTDRGVAKAKPKQQQRPREDGAAGRPAGAAGATPRSSAAAGTPARSGAPGTRSSATKPTAAGAAAGGASAGDAAAAAWCDSIAAWAVKHKSLFAAPRGLPLVDLGSQVAQLRPAGPAGEALRLKAVLAGDAKRRFVVDGDGADATVRLRPKRPTTTAAATAAASTAGAVSKAAGSTTSAARGASTVGTGAAARSAKAAPRPRDDGAPARSSAATGGAGARSSATKPAAAASVSDAAAAAWCDSIAAWAVKHKSLFAAPRGLPLIELGSQVAQLRPAGPAGEALRLKAVLAGDAKRRFVVDGDGADATVRLRQKRPAAAAGASHK